MEKDNKQKSSKQLRAWRGVQIFWSFFIGIGALGGCIMMFVIPDFLGYGENSLLTYMQVLPWPEVFFQSYTFPAICLFCANCLTNVVTLVLIFRKDRRAPLCSGMCGVVLMLWITIQFVIFPMNPLSISYFGFGVIQTVGGVAWVRLSKNSPSV